MAWGTWPLEAGPPGQVLGTRYTHLLEPAMVRLTVKHLAFLGLLLTAALSGACRPALVTQPPPLTPSAGRFFASAVRIGRDTAAHLTEVAAVEDSAGQGSVLALVVTPDTGDMLVVTHGDGTLRRYDGATGILTSVFPLGIAAAGSGAFDRDGDTVIAARVLEDIPGRELSLTRVGDIAIWNTMTGNLVQCVDMRCYRGDAYPPADLGAALSSDGSHWLVFGEGSYSVRTPNSSVAVILNAPESEFKTRLGQAAIDSEGRRVAAASVDGRVQIRGGPPYLGLQLSQGPEGEVSALSFSPDGAFLARIWNGELAVWQIGFLRGRLVLNAEAALAASLSWSSDSDLLFVAGGNEIAVWDTANWSKVTTLAAPSVEVLAQSPDDTLLLWGDTEGVVHVLAVR